MNYAREKLKSLRHKLYAAQYEILSVAHAEGIYDYNDQRLKAKNDRALILEFVLDGWTKRYREEVQIFWGSEGLNKW